MRIKYLRGSFLLMIAVVLVLGIQAQPTAQPMDPNNPGQLNPPKNNGDKAKYAPGRFIVKFKSECPEAVNEDVEYLLESNGKFQDAVSDKSDSLDKLKEKYKVKKAKSLFVERHGLTTAEAMLKQNNIRQFSKVMHQARNQRAPANAVMPDLSNVYVLEVAPESDIGQIVQEYQSDPHVEYAQPDYIREINMVPNDPYYSSVGSWGQSYDDLWGLKKIQAEQAWDITQGEGVIVAVVDTGLDYNHPDIAANVWTNPGEIPNNSIDDDGNGYIDDIRGWDFIGSDGYNPTPDNDSMDGNGHGTHVSGTIAAIGNNSIGVIGVAPQAKIMPVKGLDDQGGGWDSTLSMALIYAADQGADVINNSWGGMGASQLIEDAVNYAYSKGCVVVAAAGNSDAVVSYYYPASINKVITVAASEENDKKVNFSNWGYRIDIAAPGGSNEGLSQFNGSDSLYIYNVLSLLASNSYFEKNLGEFIVQPGYLRLGGTSMASPHVAGVAALIIQKYPTIINSEVRGRIIATADTFSEDYLQMLGAGRINADNALIAATRPYIMIRDVNLYEYTGDNDQILEAGEKFRLIMKVENVWKAASDVNISLSTENPHISPFTSSSDFGSIGMGEMKDNSSNAFIFQIGNIRHEAPVIFRADVNAYGMTQAFNFKIHLGSRKITSDMFDQGGIDIDMSRIVWTDDRGIYAQPFPQSLFQPNYDIYSYDLNLNTEKQITRNIRQQFHPTISGDKIVWEDWRNGKDNNIYLYDLKTGYEIRITGNTAFQATPVISGNKVAWIDTRNSTGGDIYVGDLAKKTEARITDSVDPKIYLDFSDNKIVWTEEQDRRPAWEDEQHVYVYDLITQQKKRLTTQPVFINAAPRLSGNKIVVAVMPGSGGGRLYVYDLASNQLTEIARNPYDLSSPDISGNLIVWKEIGTWDLGRHNDIVYIYDLSNGKKEIICSEAGMKGLVRISGNKIIWQDSRDFKSPAFPSFDIYLTEVPATVSAVQ